MSYNQRLLFGKIFNLLRENPCRKLEDLSESLRVSRQTIQKVVFASAGRTFKEFREEIFLANVRHYFGSKPSLSIKEVSSGIGCRSASSFARAIRRTCGFTPAELRSQIADEVTAAQNMEPVAQDCDANAGGLPPSTPLTAQARENIQTERSSDD